MWWIFWELGRDLHKVIKTSSNKIFASKLSKLHLHASNLKIIFIIILHKQTKLWTIFKLLNIIIIQNPESDFRKVATINLVNSSIYAIVCFQTIFKNILVGKYVGSYLLLHMKCMHAWIEYVRKYLSRPLWHLFYNLTYRNWRRWFIQYSCHHLQPFSQCTKLEK